MESSLATKFVSLFSITILSLVISISAHATPPSGENGKPKKHQFSQLDANADGNLSEDEFQRER